ncbi:alpha/beta hydrolase [Pseudonocardia endophytica]|uniref:Acetyl esterase n=1 Tax=Pseudonocardia endophytica TaxID=401976 RepID=A0A4R1HEV6_PSEEN|nr:alpha/beta hydrolase [Pseudonocardia endophytica]TCK20654.1 acetyl esterase [Pseudonocardia endophytica]
MSTSVSHAGPGLRARALRTALHAVLGMPLPLKRALAGRPVHVDGQDLDLDFQVLRTVTGSNRGRAAPPRDARTIRTGQSFFGGVVAGDPEPGVLRTDTTVPGADGDLTARLYTPDTLTGASPVLVYFHGGGFVAGGVDTHDGLCAALCADAEVRVLSVEYRLAPEHPFPAPVEDCVAAFGYVAGHPDRFGAVAGSVAVGGDSAGGSLALTVAHETVRSGGPVPAFVLAFFPVVDLVPTAPSRTLFGHGFFLTSEAIDVLTSWYVPDELRSDPRLALTDSDLAGMPPVYVATAGFDPLRDEAEALVDRLRAAGVPATLRRHPDLVHGFATALGIGPRPRQAVAEAAVALRAALLPAPADPAEP